jgi:hypothetical protein
MSGPYYSSAHYTTFAPKEHLCAISMRSGCVLDVREGYTGVKKTPNGWRTPMGDQYKKGNETMFMLEGTAATDIYRLDVKLVEQEAAVKQYRVRDLKTRERKALEAFAARLRAFFRRARPSTAASQRADYRFG